MKRLLPTLSFSIYHLSFSVALLFLASCTLYMDEPEDAGRILRTGEGYDKVETITLPEGQGTVSYQYSQNTIPIDDVVEQYIVKVESDTILHFSFATPEELLPEVGEMMTCSFRDRFPHAFCHKCIERTEQDGIYRCVFTKCSFDEAFATLKMDTHTTNFTPADGSEEVPAEEFDSIINEYKAAGDEGAVSAARGYYQHATRTAFDTGNRTLKGIKHNIADLTLNPNIKGFAGVSVTVSGGITVGGYVDISYDSEAGKLDEEYGIMGQLDLTFAVVADAGIKFQSPVAIPILGLKIDLLVVGLDIGLTANPYIDIRHQAKADFKFSLGFDIATAYSQRGKEKNGNFTPKKGSVRRKSKMPVFRVVPRDFDSSSKVVLNVKSGVDYHIGFGADIIGTGFDLAAGVDVYEEFEQEIDAGEYQSADDFQQKNAVLPTYAQPYVEGNIKVLGVTVPAKSTFGPFECNRLGVPILPVYKEGTAAFYCSDFNRPYTYKMRAELEDLGLLGEFWPFLPKMRIYMEDGDRKIPEEAFDLKWKSGSDMRVLELTKRSDNILTNVPYIAQFALVESMPGGKSITLPLKDIPFMVEMPELTIDEDKLRVVQTLTPQNATAQELANPSVIARKGDTYAWVQNGVAYRYRYKVDVPITVEGTRLIRNWGLQLGDKYANTSNFSHKESKSDPSVNYVVRMTWFANEPSIYLYFRPWADTQDAKGNKGSKVWFEAVEITANYSKLLDKQFSVTDKSPDFEKSRGMFDTPWDVDTTNLPFGDKPVIGDIELIPIVER